MMCRFFHVLQHTGLHFRHTDNTVQWLRAMESIGLPKVKFSVKYIYNPHLSTYPDTLLVQSINFKLLYICAEITLKFTALLPSV